MSLPQRGSGRLSPRNTVRTMRAAWLRLQRSWRPVRDMDPEFWRKLGAELSSVRPWIDRGIVLAYAALTGLIVVGFTLLAEAATLDTGADRGCCGGPAALCRAPWARAFRRWCARSTTTSIRRTSEAGWSRCACRCTRSGWSRAACWPGCRSAARARRSRSVPASWSAPGAGCRRNRASTAHDLMVAGAAAGIAAAFNTPLGGIVFALEQLTRRRHISHSSLVIASHRAGRPGGGGRVRQRDLLRPPACAGLSWSLLPGLLVALVAGLSGGLFSRLIVVSVRGLPDRFSRWRSAIRCALPPAAAWPWR
jgi:H+/Cl- antiporter ClcA